MTSKQNSDTTPPVWQIITGAVFGFVFITAILLLTIYLPNFNAQQYAIIKTVLALAASGIAGIFTGFIELNGTITKVTVRAGGALAVFVIVFFFTPEPPESLMEDAATVPQEINMNAIGDNPTQIGVIEGDVTFNKDLNAKRKPVGEQ